MRSRLPARPSAPAFSFAISLSTALSFCDFTGSKPDFCMVIPSVKELSGTERQSARTFQLPHQQESRLVPVPLNGPKCHAAHVGDVGEREAAKVLEIHHLGETCIASH